MSDTDNNNSSAPEVIPAYDVTLSPVNPGAIVTYTLNKDGETTLEIPQYSQIMGAHCQQPAERLVLHVFVQDYSETSPTATRTFWVVAPNPVSTPVGNGYEYIATCYCPHMVHVFEKVIIS